MNVATLEPVPEYFPGDDDDEPLWLALTHDEALDLFIKLALDDDFIDIRRRLELLMKHGPKLKLVDDE